jgi:hypothetical protein
MSLNMNETIRQRIHSSIKELSRKVSETENDLQSICKTMKPLSLSDKRTSSQIIE